jgi:hypothetical protein
MRHGKHSPVIRASPGVLKFFALNPKKFAALWIVD